MSTTYDLPEGWAVNFSQSKELIYQLHGDILPANFQLDIDESSNFAETKDFAVDVPDSLQDTAKPGFVFQNPLTGARLQKGMDGRWRKIKEMAQKAKQKAKQFVGKIAGKKQKPPVPPAPEEEYDPEYLPPKGLEDGDKEEEGPSRPAPDKLQKNMKPEVSDEDAEEMGNDPEIKEAMDKVGESFEKAYAAGTSEEEKKQILDEAKKLALSAGKKMALKTGETPSVIAKTIMKEGQRAFLPKAMEGLKQEAIETYQQMLHKKKEAQDAGIPSMKAYSQWEPYSNKFADLGKKMNEIHSKLGNDESFDDFIKQVQEEGIKAYQADNLKNAGYKKKEEGEGEQEKKENISQTLIKSLDDLKGITEKSAYPEEMSDMLDNIQAGLLDPLTQSKDIAQAVKEINEEMDDDEKETFADELRELLDSVLEMAKTKQEGYLEGAKAITQMVKTLKDSGLDEKFFSKLVTDGSTKKEEEQEGLDKKEAMTLGAKKDALEQAGIIIDDIPAMLGKQSLSVKGPLKSYLGDLSSGLFKLINPDDINGSIEQLNGKGQGYKDSIASTIEGCYNYLKNAKNLGDPSADTAIQSFSSLVNKLKELGLEDFLPEREPWAEKEEKEEKLNPKELFAKIYEIKDGFLDLLGPQSLSVKNGIKKDLEYLQQMFFEFLDEDSLSSDIEDLKDSEPFQKAEVKNKFVQLGKKIKNMEGLGDPNAEEAINKYKEMIKSLQGMGLEEFLPKIRQKKEDQVKPDIDIPEEEQNYGKMLEPDFRYEPTVKFEDLGEKWREGFNAYVESSQKLIDGGKLPDIYNGVTADSMAAMRKYTGSSYTWMNNLARGKADITQDPSLKKYDYMLGLVDQGLQAMKLQPPETLKRGVGSAKLRKAFSARKPGEMIYDHGYFSASSSKGTAQSFEGYGTSSVMFTIKNAQGYYVDTISECKGEEERIFPRGSAFKITKIEELPNGQLSVEMEHVLSDSEKEKYQKQTENEKQKEEEKPPVEIPQSIDESVYNSGKKLGGSTGARLVDINGNKFVVKMGANEQQNQQEQLANSFYKTIGAKTSNSALSEMGGKKVVVSEYIPGKDLGKQILTVKNVKEFGQQIIKGHAIDALINNRDVFGLEYDNIRVGENGEIYRIDNGGSFDTKATGGKKPFDGVPLEFFSMLERGGGREFYEDVPVKAAYDSLDNLFQNMKEIKQIAETQVPDNLKEAFLKRLSNLREIKDCWDYARSSKYGDDEECHEVVKRYITQLHKKDPNGAVSYIQFKKFMRQ